MANLSMNLVSAVLLDDGWHEIQAGTIGVALDPAFTDPNTGQAITPGGPWLMFTDASGQDYGCPINAVRAVQWTPPAQPTPTS